METARRARLVLAAAARPPNWIIWGSFWNCGAPPDNEIAVATHRDDSSVVTNVALKAAIQSAGLGVPALAARIRKTASAAVPPRPKFTRLNVSFRGAWRAHTRAVPEPTRRAWRYSVGVSRKRPMTAGNSLSENECCSRRKWTTTTF